jgi:N-formylglutamate deformylase
MEAVEITEGTSPVILGLPHTGTHVPPDVWAALNANGRLLADTDWHIHRLYEGLLPAATSVRALFHRYVIDANRDPQDTSLYPGQNTTGLVPLTDFNGERIWTSDPDETAIAARLAQYHAVYHRALAVQVERVKAMHGIAILYDCHSIRSRIPFLFEGVLPDFNVGTNDGKSCDQQIEEIVSGFAAASGRTYVLNGRFKGGWTTRHYGRPSHGVHAIQMELAQSTHLASEAPPFAYDAAKADGLRETLAAMLSALDKWGRAHAGA